MLHHHASETAAAVGAERVDVLDLRGLPVASELAVRRDGIAGEGREVPRRHRGRDQALRTEQLLGEGDAAVRLGKRDAGVRLDQHLQRHFTDGARVDEPVGFPPVGQHEVRRSCPTEPSSSAAIATPSRVGRDPPMPEALHQRVRLGGVFLGGRHSLDPEVVRVVDGRDRVAEEPDAVRERLAPLGGRSSSRRLNAWIRSITRVCMSAIGKLCQPTLEQPPLGPAGASSSART